jgi:hypothetical protein
VVVQCGEVLVIPGAGYLSGVVEPQPLELFAPRQQPHFEIYLPNFFSALGSATGDISHCYRLPLSLSLGGDSVGSLEQPLPVP